MAKTSDRYLRMYSPVLEVLRSLGGSGTPKEVVPAVLAKFDFSDEELTETTSSGALRIENEVRWAGAYLKELELIDGSEHGVWRLTREGQERELTIEEARKLKNDLLRKKNKSRKSNKKKDDDQDPEIIGEEDESEDVLAVLRNLSPSGFERFCQRLLREVGFSEVHVTGRSGDGGIDGHGTLQVNHLVSFNVLFQCKRYTGSVRSGEIRNFRGSMTGRTDKGIFITTGVFTRDAIAEASRDGAPPIELVDNTRLISLMEKFELGLKKTTIYVVDQKFFEIYQN